MFPRTIEYRDIPEQENVRSRDSLTVDSMIGANYLSTEWGMGIRYRDEPCFSTTLQYFAMSRLLFWILSTIGFWVNFWRCRAILLYPENTLFQFTLGISMPVVMTKRGGIAFSSGFQLNYDLPWNLSQFEPTIIPARHIRDLNLQETYVAIENLLNERSIKFPTDISMVSICPALTAPSRLAERASCRPRNFTRRAEFVQWKEKRFEFEIRRTKCRAKLPRKIARWITKCDRCTREHGWQDGRQCLLRTICELAETPLHRTQQDVLGEVIHLILTPTEDLPVAINSNHRSANKLYQEAERLGRSGGDCILMYPDCIESPLESFTEIVFP
ncbi:hypothetical protein ALC53_09162 [Atta colombica]|uniref:Uncharacterized protein n=1 Tax=Atta colombica TaxID=520822 RepID=A0A151I1P5_9HYME|nr:hypothetical protein ALC53_09162 [Atta colombica]